MKRYLLIAILIVLISCKNKNVIFVVETDTFDSFCINGQLEGEQLSYEVLGAKKLSFIDSILLVYTVNPDAFLTLINTRTDSILVNICPHGRGPEEYLYFTTYNQFFTDTLTGNECLYTFNSDNTLMVVDISESISKKQTVISKKEYLPKKIYDKNILIGYNGGFFVKFPVTYEDARDQIFYRPKYLYYEDDFKKEKEIDFFGEKLVRNKDLSLSFLHIYNGNIAINPDKNKIVDAFYYMDYINIIDLENYSVISFRYSNSISFDDIEKLSLSELENNYRYGYIDISVNDEYIFALYGGYSDKDDESLIKTSLRIFNWKGAALANIQMDKYLLSICYDAKNEQLFGVDYEENIYKYAMSELLKEIKAL